VNPDDTSRCPVGPECESCGRTDELAVSTADTPAGVICMTVCDACELIAGAPGPQPSRGDHPRARARCARGVEVGSTSAGWHLGRVLPPLRVPARHGLDPGAMRTAHRRPPLPGLPPGRILIPGHSELTLGVTELRPSIPAGRGRPTMSCSGPTRTSASGVVYRQVEDPPANRRAPISVKASSLRSSLRTLDPGAVVRSGSSRARRPAGWPAGLC
jgi:hypothetical protein